MQDQFAIRWHSALVCAVPDVVALTFEERDRQEHASDARDDDHRAPA
jgi:hypothetical protein